MHDRRPAAQQSQRHASGRGRSRIRHSSVGTPRRASARELLRTGLALVQHEHARVEAALAEQRQERQEVRPPSPRSPRPSGCAGRASRDRGEHSVGPCSVEWSRKHARELEPDRVAVLPAPAAASARRRAASSPRRPGRSEARARSRRRAGRTRGSRRRSAGRCGRFVHDLVERSRPHVVDQHVDCRIHARRSHDAPPAP